MRHGHEVAGIRRRDDGVFELKCANGAIVEAECVVLGIGLQGNIRKLGVPGEDLPFVQYQLDDPDEYEGETIVVVGAGDAAIENAVALAQAEPRDHHQPQATNSRAPRRATSRRS